jgi:hypothetical protein
MSLVYMLEFSALTPGKGEQPQTEVSGLHETLASRMAQQKTPQEKKTVRIGQTVPSQSVREFIEHREDPAARAERMGLPGMIEDLRERLCQVEATIRIFKRLEASKCRGLANPARRPSAWTTPRRINQPSSSV